jgi:predicted TIM-barrel fold metal-dependent hydrolase
LHAWAEIDYQRQRQGFQPIEVSMIGRRAFMAAASAMLVAGCRSARQAANAPAEPADGIIDIHQHTRYSGRSDEALIAHQRTMGITKTVLLPAGQYVQRESTHFGKSNGLAAGILGNESAVAIARQFPGEFYFFANEVPDLPGARQEIEKYLKMGAKGIGEQKFNLDCDSPPMQEIFALARDYGVPVLMHFQHEMYNKGYERMGKVLKKWQEVNFIGHAQTFWANIDRGHADQAVLYPKTPVTSGGLTDRYLSEFPNFYGDMSAGSGLNALLRDEAHAREFMERHQDRLLYGSDCNDTAGAGEKCSGSQQIAAIRRLAPSKEIERKIFWGNARRLLKL